MTVGIGQRLFDEMQPSWLRIGGYWYPRGGIPIDVFWQSGRGARGPVGAGSGRGRLSRAGVMRKLPVSAVAAALLGALSAPLSANDSSASIGLGGLVLERNEAISMDAEDLYISKSEVRVRYRYTNRSSRDVETLVSFPVPVLPGGVSGFLDGGDYPDPGNLKFRTTVNGRAVRLDTVVRAEIAGRDVTARLAALGWPLRWFDDPAFVGKLSAADRLTFGERGC